MRAFGRTISIAAVLVSLAGMAAAADIRVLSVGAVQNAVRPLAAEFSKETGHKIVFTVGSPTVVAQKLKDGETFDAVIVSEPAMDRLDNEGIVNPESRVRLANTGIGVAVRAGAPVPNLSTPDAFRQALLAAKSVVYGDPALPNQSGEKAEQILAKAAGIGGGMLALPVSTAAVGFTNSIFCLILSWLVMTLGALLVLEVNLRLPA